jgi:hypothetical protein
MIAGSLSSLSLVSFYPAVLTIVRPETLVRWHRAGFRCYWRWKSRHREGTADRHGATRIDPPDEQGESALGCATHSANCSSSGLRSRSPAKYMVKRRGPPSQGWRTFLRNHAPDIAAMDLFVVPTLDFDLLYAFVIVRLDRRDLVWINVTANPMAEWVTFSTCTMKVPAPIWRARNCRVTKLHGLRRPL